MNKSLITLLVVSFIVNTILIYVFIFKGETTSSTDNRTKLQMSDSNRDFLLLEMRDFLESVQQINEGIINKNPDIII